MERWVLIANPSSAAGKTKKLAASIREALNQEIGEVNLLFTDAPGHATELCASAIREGTQTVVSLGGDGTHNEVVNGYLDSNGTPLNPDTNLGILPSGTGGDFARLLYSTRAPLVAAKQLVGGTGRLVDVGMCRFTTDDGETKERYFLNIGSFGMGGLVVRLANRGPKFMGAKGTFLFGVARSILKYRNSQVHMTVDGTPLSPRKVRLVSVSNGRFFGGGMKAAPSAKLDDGLFDLVTLGDVSFSRLVPLIRRVYKGTHVTHPDVEYMNGRWVEARPGDDQKDAVLVELDGEGVGRLPARFEILERRLRLIFPSDAPIETS